MGPIQRFNPINKGLDIKWHILISGEPYGLLFNPKSWTLFADQNKTGHYHRLGSTPVQHIPGIRVDWYFNYFGVDLQVLLELPHLEFLFLFLLTPLPIKSFHQPPWPTLHTRDMGEYSKYHGHDILWRHILYDSNKIKTTVINLGFCQCSSLVVKNLK